MKDYLDLRNKPLRKGFYQDKDNSEVLYYTGKLNDNSFPMFENGDKAYPLDSNYVYYNLVRAGKKEAKKEMNELENKVNWLKKILSK